MKNILKGAFGFGRGGKRRHQTLGYKLPESRQWTLDDFRSRRKKLAARLDAPDRGQAETRGQQISVAVREAVFGHLGFEPEPGLLDRLNQGVDQAIEYFTGDWWKASLGLEDDEECDAPFMDRDAEYAPQCWCHPLLSGLLLCDWTDRWDDSKVMVDWVDDRVARGFTENHDPDIALPFFLLVASMLREQPLSCHQDLRSPDCRDMGQRHQRLCRIAIAIDDHDDAITEMIPDSVRRFLKSESRKAPNFMFWIDDQLALLWSIARRRGMTLPEITSDIDAVIPRQESVLAATS